MKYKVKVVGILKANGQLANFGDILEDADLIDANASLKEGYVDLHEVKADPKTKTKEVVEDTEKVDSETSDDQDTAKDTSADKSEVTTDKKLKPLI